MVLGADTGLSTVVTSARASEQRLQYVKRSLFSGVGGGKGTDDNIGLVSFRYAPFQ